MQQTKWVYGELSRVFKKRQTGKTEDRKEVHFLGRMTKELEKTMSNVLYTRAELDAVKTSIKKKKNWKRLKYILKTS